MIKRSAAVALAVALQCLAQGRPELLTEDQLLILDALRRSKDSLRTASDEELGQYIRSLDPDQLRGVVSNVKGIYHELLVKRAENVDGDAETARLFEALNHPGADLEFLVDGDVVREVQLKAVQSPAAIIAHFEKYPDIDVMATTEVYTAIGDAFPGRVADSRFRNDEITDETEEAFAALRGETVSDLVEDGIVSSTLVTGALQARAILAGRDVDPAALRSALEAAGIGIATTVAMEALLGAV